MRVGAWQDAAERWVYFIKGHAPNKIVITHASEGYETLVWYEYPQHSNQRWLKLPHFHTLEEAKAMGMMTYRAINDEG
jgi:hypothetical protein